MRTLKQLLDTFPELQEILLDATEHQLLHPSDKRTRHRSGCGKPKNRTIKDQNGPPPALVHCAYDVFPGVLQERPPLRASNVSMQKPPWLDTELDRAYESATPLDSSESVSSVSVSQQDYHPLHQAA